MAAPIEVVKQSDLLNQLVISCNTMEEIGRVEVVWMHPPVHRVLGFICKSGFLGKRKTAYNLSQLKTLGANGVLVQADPVETDAEKVRQLESLINCEIWSDAGNKVGKVTDCLFNLKTGVITQYLFVSSGWGGVTGDVYLLPPKKVLSFGARRVLVPESATRSFTVYQEGLKYKFTKATESIKEDYTQVTQELRSLAKQAQSATEQAKEKARSLAEQAKEKAQTLSEQLKEETETLAKQAKDKSQTFAEQLQERSYSVIDPLQNHGSGTDVDEIWPDEDIDSWFDEDEFDPTEEDDLWPEDEPPKQPEEKSKPADKSETTHQSTPQPIITPPPKPTPMAQTPPSSPAVSPPTSGSANSDVHQTTKQVAEPDTSDPWDDEEPWV